MKTEFVIHADCFDFVDALEPNSVQLVATDPPYMGIVEDSWDNQWPTTKAYVDWMYALFVALKPKMTKTASLLFFGGIGKHGQRPFFKLMEKIEETCMASTQNRGPCGFPADAHPLLTCPGFESLFTYRNTITWKKRRAYGKSHDYLFCREEIAWYSVSAERTEVTFNIPLTDVKRGYAGFNEKYPAKSEFKRVSNVWDDIPELMRPERNTQKPIPLMERVVRTHSNEGDKVVDPFCGWGTTGVASENLGRDFLGSEAIEADAEKANKRCLAAHRARI